ncbi:MAG TPA: metallophosphoesterase [Euryarchaeota archaeon]|nr:MAG: YfcE family phosphodiesterase [Thermococci archaeon]RLF97145.1 MAG: YfcE family phosphodiesterase [Thermococci archaeon]HDI10339.1 metallophosphoesterase [Euryarchaeota archaeon]
MEGLLRSIRKREFGTLGKGGPSMRVLVIGDTHIPERAEEIPRKLWKEIVKEEFDLVLCTGDLVSEEVLEELEEIGEVKAVRGNMDYLDLPMRETVDLGFRVGLTHGAEVYPRGNKEQLYDIAIEMNVSVLISGHTHRSDFSIYREVVLFNPGSATGVWSGGKADGIPSFGILIPEEREFRIKKLIHGEVVTKRYKF